MDPTNAYHTSAILGATLDVATSPLRFSSTRLDAWARAGAGAGGGGAPLLGGGGAFGGGGRAPAPGRLGWRPGLGGSDLTGVVEACVTIGIF